MVFVMPVPGIAIFPGISVKVHDPLSGNPFNITLPVGNSATG